MSDDNHDDVEEQGVEEERKKSDKKVPLLGEIIGTIRVCATVLQREGRHNVQSASGVVLWYASISLIQRGFFGGMGWI